MIMAITTLPEYLVKKLFLKFVIICQDTAQQFLSNDNTICASLKMDSGNFNLISFPNKFDSLTPLSSKQSSSMQFYNLNMVSKSKILQMHQIYARSLYNTIGREQ